MKRIVFLLTGLFASSWVIYAQENIPVQASYECLYEYQVTNEKGDRDTYATILQIGSHAARFLDYTAYQTDSIGQSPNTSQEEVEKFQKQEQRNEFFFDQTVWQNQPTNKMSVYSVIPPDRYTYTENSHSVQWTLTEDTDTVCGYICHKATGAYGGRMWTAWYAQDIPVPFGPWKLCGLPGLVMQATDADGIHSFEAIAFRKGITDIPAPNTKNCIKTTRDKFVKMKNNFEKNPMGNIPFETIGRMVIDKQGGGKGTIFIDGQQLRIRPNGYVPLELQ